MNKEDRKIIRRANRRLRKAIKRTTENKEFKKWIQQITPTLKQLENTTEYHEETFTRAWISVEVDLFRDDYEQLQNIALKKGFHSTDEFMQDIIQKILIEDDRREYL